MQGTHPQILPWTDDVSIAYEQFGTHAHYGRLAERAPRSCGRARASGIARRRVDEGAILAGLVDGLGGAFLGEERALVEELRAAGLAAGRAARRVPAAPAWSCSRRVASTCRASSPTR